MMSRLKMVRHSTTQRDIVEVWSGNLFIACIYPHDGGVRVISKHPIETEVDTTPPCPPNALVVRVRP